MSDYRTTFMKRAKRGLGVGARWGAPAGILCLLLLAIASGFGFIECGWASRGTLAIQKNTIYVNNLEPVKMKFRARLDVDVTRNINICWDKDRVAITEWLASTVALPSLETARNAGAPLQWQVGLPIWLPMLVLSGITWLGWRCRMRRRLGPLQCANCGYSLRGIHGATCPECGTGSRSSTAPKQSSATDPGE